MQFKSIQALAKNFAQATDESARPRQHDSKCKSRALKLLPIPCTGTRGGKTTFTSFNHANPWALAKALLREQMNQQDRVYIVQRHANQELLGSCQTLQRERKSQQDHVHIIQICKHCGPMPNLAEGADESARPRLHHSRHANQELLGSCQTLQRERKSQQDHVHIIQTCKLLGPCQTSLRERMSQQDHDYIIQDMQIKSSWALAKTLQRERMSQQDHVYIQRTCK